MDDNQILSHAEIAAWLGITPDQTKSLPITPLPKRRPGGRKLYLRAAVRRKLGLSDDGGGPPSWVHTRPHR